MKFDSTFTFALIVSLTALISPIFVAIINNRHIRKVKKMEIEQENFKIINIHKREIFENYLNVIGEFSFNQTETSLSELTKSYYAILPYIPSEKAIFFREFSAYASNMDFSQTDERISLLLHEEIIPVIKSEIEKL